MTEEAPLLEDVRQWLEHGGYVLEMEVARKLLLRTNLVSQGESYVDPSTDKEREIDVTAYLLRSDTDSDSEMRLHGLDLIIECKSTNAPWICFVGPSTENGAWTASSFMDSEHCAVCERIEDVSWRIESGMMRAYAVTEKRAGNTVDHAYASVRQAASALMARYGGTTSDRGHDEATAVSTLAVPIVVTTSPLVLCSLDDTGTVQLEQVERLSVLVANRAVPDDTDGIAITVVTYSGLDALLDDLAEAITDGSGEDEGAAGGGALDLK